MPVPNCHIFAGIPSRFYDDRRPCVWLPSLPINTLAVVLLFCLMCCHFGASVRERRQFANVAFADIAVLPSAWQVPPASFGGMKLGLAG